MRKELTIQDIADIRAALDLALAHDSADHGEPSRVIFAKANRALDRVGLAVVTMLKEKAQVTRPHKYTPTA